MNTPASIPVLQERLEKLQEGLKEGYAAFGESCASAERISPLGSCHDQWAAFDSCLEEVGRRQRDYQRLKHHFEAVSDASKRIRAMETELKQVALEKESLAVRLGAASYEAYLGGHGEELSKFLDPVFHEYAQASQSHSDTFLGRVKLLGRQRGAQKLFLKAGLLLLEKKNYQLVPNDKLVGEVESLLARESEALQNLASDKECVQGAEKMTDKARLERDEKQLKELQGTLAHLAYVYGKAVFDEVPPPVIQQKVGEKAYQQGLEILSLQDTIGQMARKINQMEGERRAAEIDAEVALKKQRVQLLEEQKKELDAQISQLYGEMNELKRKALKLRGPNV